MFSKLVAFDKTRPKNYRLHTIIACGRQASKGGDDLQTSPAYRLQRENHAIGLGYCQYQLLNRVFFNSSHSNRNLKDEIGLGQRSEPLSVTIVATSSITLFDSSSTYFNSLG